MLVLGAAPAAADVDCGDLKTQAAAQAYLEGRTGDPDRLDADADGRACESSTPTHPGTWTLIGLGALLAGGLVRYTKLESKRKTQHAEAPRPPEHATVSAPVVVEQMAVEVAEGVAPVRHRLGVVNSATTGSLGELARALRMVQYSQRMALLEAHAAEHGQAPREVLDHLAENTSDLELQGWALAGYDPPWTVRVMRCSCVDGMRNFQLRTAPDGTRFWSCATCHTADRHLS
jgi:hypothetical protein